VLLGWTQRIGFFLVNSDPADIVLSSSAEAITSVGNNKQVEGGNTMLGPLLRCLRATFFDGIRTTGVRAPVLTVAIS
jgi:hypothetical protein